MDLDQFMAQFVWSTQNSFKNQLTRGPPGGLRI